MQHYPDRPTKGPKPFRLHKQIKGAMSSIEYSKDPNNRTDSNNRVAIVFFAISCILKWKSSPIKSSWFIKSDCRRQQWFRIQTFYPQNFQNGLKLIWGSRLPQINPKQTSVSILFANKALGFALFQIHSNFKFSLGIHYQNFHTRKRVFPSVQ